MVTFAQLWKNHPNVMGDAPLLDKAVYENQCAINMSAALIRAGVDMRTYRGIWSWQKDRPKYAIRAEELANWLAGGASRLPAKLTKYNGEEASNAFERVDHKKGIIFFKDYYGPGMTGDHIDLYNGIRMTEVSSWFRIHARISWSGVWSNFREAKSIWFWELP
ncbi:hypothetical protein C8244_00245 [Paracidovorax avenae]|uniref:type VI secretion system amidase effector protein Tae4 n=1 Tax=Paracidovorax avenae TaxID=80867 RepID=UPI000D1724CE|nr:type VI secretion system amidase effector protein Tae4 [Paracidovorax avenae]AVS79690.1 hypothetical protein C8237_00245 [Paracidovorax avenae]AVT04585.1 hypothetical protein C8248_00230 [Paracidovorax avenae]AVT14806.1 hypothetical protein C8244_00245 [Paracidovorax avenae]